MFEWLYAIDERKRLKGEIVKLEAKLITAEQRLLREIDSNRNQTDALVEVIAKERMPQRRLLLPREEEFPSEEIPELSFDEPETVDESLVRRRADAFAADYERRGVPFDYEQLCAKIRQDPDKYLSN